MSERTPNLIAEAKRKSQRFMEWAEESHASACFEESEELHEKALALDLLADIAEMLYHLERD